MENNRLYKLISAGFVGVLALVFALPASAAVASYYDQFGQLRYYETYTYYPTSGYQGYPSYGYNAYRPTNYQQYNANISSQYAGGYYNGSGYNSYNGYNNYNATYAVAGSTNHQPVIWSQPNTYATEGVTYVSSINAYDPDNDPLTFTLVSGPAGMTVGAANGSIRWETTGHGGQSFPVTISVSDGRTQPVTQSFTLTVHAANGYVYNAGGRGVTAGGAGTAGLSTCPPAITSRFSSFGASQPKPCKLQISQIAVASGPTNIYEDKTDVNCEIRVSWKTNAPSAGQVVYGTQSQASVESFSYPEVAAEGSSYQTSHEVKLGCLENTTYYFRVIAFSTAERAVSAEQTIFPIKIRTQIPVVGGTESEAGTGSALATAGRVLASPLTLIIILAIAAFFVVRRFLRKQAAEPENHEPENHLAVEPALEIPHQ